MREVKRLDSISRSPVYSSIGEALNGLPTIRAFRAEERLQLNNAELTDDSVVMSLANMSLNRCCSATCVFLARCQATDNPHMQQMTQQLEYQVPEWRRLASFLAP